MDIEEFIELYDTRIYDFNNKQDDIKILKHIDFEGVYIITNYDKNYNYIGLSDKVFRTVDRYFRGYESEEVFDDYEDGDNFTIKIVKFEDSGYDDIEELYNDIQAKYN